MTRYAAVLLLLLTAGCASAVPDSQVSQPQPQPAAPQPTAAPVAPTKLPPAPKPAATPVTPATPPAAALRVAALRAPATPPVTAPTAPAAPLPLDLNALEAQLKPTKAIGVFTKISLKNQVDDLMKQFREHYDGKTTRTMTDLRRS